MLGFRWLNLNLLICKRFILCSCLVEFWGQKEDPNSVDPPLCISLAIFTSGLLMEVVFKEITPRSSTTIS